jgi:hypothetical protein
MGRHSGLNLNPGGPSRCCLTTPAASPKLAGHGQEKASASPDLPASQLITQRIAELDDWRVKTLARMRLLIQRADPAVVEEWKWGIPAWSHDGILCTGETYKSVVKLTFAKGAAVKDPARLFNSSLDGNVRRAIDIREGAEVDATAFTALLREAIAVNGVRQAKPAKKPAVSKPSPPLKKPAAKKSPSKKKAAVKTATRKKPKS